MDCLRSFSLSSPTTQIITAPDLLTWSFVNQHYWSVSRLGFSRFDISGFKNINIHGVDVIGDMNPSNTSASACIVNDWSVRMELKGQAPFVGGSVQTSPNFLSVQNSSAFVNVFVVSRYKTRIEFSSPIQSVNQIEFSQWAANGIANQNATQVELSWNFNFIFYYTFEGE
jgi:hypothetical protein